MYCLLPWNSRLTRIAAPKGEEEDEIPPANILKHLRDRGDFSVGKGLTVDSKIQILEYEVKRMNDQMYRLKEELVPVFKYTREKVHTHPPIPHVKTSLKFLPSLIGIYLSYSHYPRPTYPLQTQHQPPAPVSPANSPRKSSSSEAVESPPTNAPWKSPNPSCHQPT
jgi:hypothetical protein